MIHVNKLAASMAAAFTMSAAMSCARDQSQNHQEMVKNQQEMVKNQQEMVKHYFAQTLKTKLNAEQNSKADFTRNANYSTDIQQQLKDKDVASSEKMVWAAWCAANRELQEEKLIKPQSLQYGGQGSWNLPQTLEPNAVMPYYYGAKGQTNGQLPLFLYLHGSGPKKQEWQTGLMLGNSFEDGPSLYFIPQIPNEGNYYRWWQVAKQFAWEKLIRQAFDDGAVDANRLYVFGISEGGYGSQRLASFYADYWAAAGPMAGGEPLKNAPVENCTNIGFSFLTGAEDDGFYRNILTRYTQEAFDSAEQARPLSADNRPLFQHRINLLERMQHSINYSLTTPWLKNFVRNPYPKTVLWEDFEMDGRHRSGFYNLQVLVRPSEQRTYYEMSIKDNVITMNINDVEYTTVERDQRWGIEMKFNRRYQLSKGGKLRIYVNEQLVDMSKPVTLIVNGKQLYQGNIKPTLQDMVNSCMEYFDPYRIFPASIEVSY